MTEPDGTGRTLRPGRRRAVRIAVLCLVVAAMLSLAAIGWLSGR